MSFLVRNIRSQVLLASVAILPAVQAGFAQAAFAQAAAVVPATPPPSGPAAAPADEETEDEAAIVITGQRDPNAVIGDIPPEKQLNAGDIRATGASNVAELLQAISPQTQSGRGRDGGQPIVLINGKRTSGFREIRDLPTEAILRTEILPEEVALKYGFRADQRVVNIVLRPRFRSTATLLRGEAPTEGGQIGGEADATRLMIGAGGRTTINVHAEGSTAIREDERDIIFTPSVPGAIDPRPFRTLIGSRRLARVGGTYNTSLFGDVSSTFDGQIEWSDGHSLLGPSLSQLGEPLRRDSDSLSGHLGLAFNGQQASWRWSVTGGYDISRSATTTERETIAPILFEDISRSVNRTGNLDAVFTGPLFRIPAGKVNLTLRAGGDTRDLSSRARRAGIETEADLGRDRLSSSFNLDVPIAKRNGPLSAIGNLSLNANAEVERFSDFGTLTTIGAGVFWSPVNRMNLIASWTREEGPPSLSQLGDPVLVTPNSLVFDFVNGVTALVDTVTGGNPALLADTRRVYKLGGTFQPFPKTDLNLRADFTRTRFANPIASFPGPTAAIEAAFPGRFVRDPGGNLIRVDMRPVNYASSARDEIRWGFTFTKQLRSAPPSPAFFEELRRRAGAGGAPGAAAPGGTPTPGGGGAQGQRPAAPGAAGPGAAGRPGGGTPGQGGGFPQGGFPPGGFGGQGGFVPGGFGGGGPGGGGGGGPQGGRLNLSIFHTIVLKDQVLIAPGLPVLDYLNGEAVGGGVRSRHRVDVDAGWSNNGIGVRLSGNWQSGGTVTSGASVLDFAPLMRVNFNIFANLGDRLDLSLKHPWMRGLQIRLNVQNVFEAKQKVRDSAGVVPINYQPDLRDPRGRVVSISIRKMFSPRPAQQPARRGPPRG